MSDAALWWIALGAGAAVIGVVALLLRLILAAARDIGGVLDEIWVAGPRVAASTAHLDLVRRIDHHLAELPPVADRIGAAVDRLHRHASGCPGCPMCVTGWGGGEGP